MLRLSGGVTKSYVHVVNGKLVRVNQYRTPHPAQAKYHAQAWGQLKAGQTVVIRNVPYKVVKANVVSKTTGTKSTTHGKNTGSQGKNVNAASNSAVTTAAKQAAAAKQFGTVTQNPSSALLQGVQTAAGAKRVTMELMQPTSGKTFFVTVPTTLTVNVLG